MKPKIKMKKHSGQALLVVLLISTICLIIVTGLALRTVRRIKSARQAKEYQVAYGQALTGVQLAATAIQSGLIDGVDLLDCTAENPCEISGGDDSQGYSVLIYPAELENVQILKDRSVDIWPISSDAETIILTCEEAVDIGDRGLTATFIFEKTNPLAGGDDYEVDKQTLLCSADQVWGFTPCNPVLSECRLEENIFSAEIPQADYALVLARIKAFSQSDSDLVEVSAQLLDSAGGLVASTASYQVDSFGYGYDGSSSTLSVVVSPGGLPYPFDFVLFSGE